MSQTAKPANTPVYWLEHHHAAYGQRWQVHSGTVVGETATELHVALDYTPLLQVTQTVKPITIGKRGDIFFKPAEADALALARNTQELEQHEREGCIWAWFGFILFGLFAGIVALTVWDHYRRY